MASWKKVIVSGSNANLTALQVDTLALNQVVLGGGSGSNLTTTTINGSGSILATTGSTGVSMTGSFTGSFTGALIGTASFATTASYITGSGVYGPYGANSVISASYAVVASSSFGTLTFGEGLTTNTFNGSRNVTVQVSGAAQLTNNAITKWDNTDNKFVSSSLIDNGTTILGSSSIQLTGANSSLTGSFSGSFKGDGSGLSGLATTLSITASNYTGQTQTSGSVSLTSQGLNIVGTQNEITVTASLQTITIGLPDDVTVANNLTVSGDLIVNGTTTTLDTTNLTVEDRFIVLNHGSGSVAPTQEGGIIIEGTTAGSGSAFYYDGATQNRWGVALGIADTATSVTANSYVVTVSSSNINPAGNPTYGGLTAGFGNMYINSNDETIWVYS